ncbi:MAG: prepilin-type N-terminal cleavage/methylation domain-containing protein [Candidatus Paceibacterota bacterium]|jgi:Tfp pilus assembly protein PilV
MTKNKKNLKGFTLIETFVAITILMIVVLGPMSLLSTALRDSRYVGDEITATYLAQEGVELMVDQSNDTPPTMECSAPAAAWCSCPLELNPSNGYQCGPAGSTVFSREITVNPTTLPRQYEIISKVTIKRAILPPKDVVSSTIIFTK